jgi:starch phosphorylase
MLQAVAEVANDPRTRHRFVFIEDYDIEVGRMMYQGVDVWLNTPIRPHEACGTSGMKVVFNGALNCSILDGWWAELYENDFGWAIPSAVHAADQGARDEIESRSLYRIIEEQIAPLFYTREGEGLPASWLDRMRASMANLCPQVEAGRMLRQYVTDFYEPAARRSAHMLADGARAAKGLAAWKQRVDESWDGLKILGSEQANTDNELGQDLVIRATIELGDLEPADVEAQVLHGPVDVAGELEAPSITVMRPEGRGTPRTYVAEIPCSRAGAFGYTVRVVPSHPDLDRFTDVGRITWLEGAVDPG